MTTVTLRELAHDTGRVARLLRAGERIELTDRGRYLATIDPRRPEGVDRREQLVAEGRLRPAQHHGYLPRCCCSAVWTSCRSTSRWWPARSS